MFNQDWTMLLLMVLGFAALRGMMIFAEKA